MSKVESQVDVRPCLKRRMSFFVYQTRSSSFEEHTRTPETPRSPKKLTREQTCVGPVEGFTLGPSVYTWCKYSHNWLVTEYSDSVLSTTYTAKGEILLTTRYTNTRHTRMSKENWVIYERQNKKLSYQISKTFLTHSLTKHVNDS